MSTRPNGSSKLSSRKRGDRSRASPAEGERQAVRGYRFQYQVSAFLLLRALKARDLEWIRIADPQAGRVDDFQIGTDHNLDAYQMKSELYGGSFSFRDLVRGSKRSPCIITQLVDGWKRLKRLYPNRGIRVHLITNRSPSKSDRLPSQGRSPRAALHFAAFFEQCWTHMHNLSRHRKAQVSSEWRPAWEVLRKASKLSDQEFRVFVTECVLEFNFKFPAAAPGSSREVEALHQDLRQLSDFLFEAVADPAKLVYLNRQQLLTRLEWAGRFEFKSRHEFPVNERLYYPIKSTAERLRRALEDLPGGYLALLGTPGSGKSTLLTQVLRTWPGRVVRYYAYVPDSQDPAVPRGESVNFLHDVILALQKNGFSAGETPNRFERQLLLERLHQLLDQLHKDWAATGRKTVILIDGLDHVAREQRPDHSLIGDLPLPEQIRDGVLFLLGSQTDLPLNDQVQAEIRQPNRRIEMDTLNREAVFRITGKFPLAVAPSRKQKDQIYSLSGGHPLALLYLLNRLGEATDGVCSQAILDSAIQYSGNIERQYHSYWRGIESDYDLVHLTGLVARLRNGLDLPWVSKWANGRALHDFGRLFGHYFRREENGRWYFFHNSFRLFLVQRTCEAFAGEFDSAKDQEFHRELARYCAREAGSSPLGWEELYHLCQGGQHEEVVHTARAEWFRHQFFAFRPADSIKQDIYLALRSALATRSATAFCDLVFSGAEIEQREGYLERSTYLYLLVDLGHRNIAVEHIRDGNRLRVESEVALALSSRMYASGWKEEARRIFELAEPLDLLQTGTPIDDPQGHRAQLLSTWAEIATQFRPLREVLRLIDRVKIAGDTFRRMDAKTATRALRRNLFYRVGQCLVAARRWEELYQVERKLDLGKKEDASFWFWLEYDVICELANGGSAGLALKRFNKLAKDIKQNARSASQRIALAELSIVFFGNHEGARSLIADVPQPALATDHFSSEAGMQAFMTRFRLNRLLYGLGSNDNPSRIVPLPEDKYHVGLAYFERAVCTLAQIWGFAWRGKRLPSSEIAQRVHPLLRLFVRSPEERRDWHSWYTATGARPEFFSMLVRAVALHGSEALQTLRDNFESEWRDPQTRSFWPPSVIRAVAVALWKAGIEKRWAIERLNEVQNRMLEGEDVSGRIGECISQADSWLAFNERDAAESALRLMLAQSLGVGYRKDYQTDEWVEWLGKINAVQPDQAPSRISWFAQAIASLEETTEGRATGLASLKLLEVAFDWSPVRSVALRRWLLEHGLVDYEDSLALLLRKAVCRSPNLYRFAALCLVHLLLPISTTSEAELVDAVLAAASATNGMAAAGTTSNEILRAVNIYGMPSSRRGWLESVCDSLSRLGSDLKELKLTRPEEKPRTDVVDAHQLKLKNGELLTLGQVLDRVKTSADMLALMSSEAEPAVFRWPLVLKQLVAGATIVELQALSKVLDAKERHWEVLTIFSERARQLGDERLAREFAAHALEESKPYGWARWYDGGSRISALTAMAAIDPVATTLTAFETIVKDLAGGLMRFHPIAENLNSILPLLAPGNPVQEVWPKIEAYVHTLFAGSFPEALQPPDLNEVAALDSPRSTLVELLAGALCHPVSCVMAGALKCLTGAVLWDDSECVKLLVQMLQRDEPSQESALIVLDATTQTEPMLATKLMPHFVALAQSPNFAVRSIAKKIADRAGHKFAISNSPRELPAIYKLALPPDRFEGYSDGLVEEGKPLPDSSLASDIVRPFGPELQAIADEASIPKENIYQRTVQVMCSLADRESWSAKAEQRFRDYLEAVGLRFPFRRPRSSLARRAMFHVVAELLDGGALTATSLHKLSLPLRFYDPHFLTIDPVEHPAEITVMAEVGDYGQVPSDWLTRMDQAAPSFCRFLADGRVVLAEETQLKRLAWDVPGEIRKSGVAVASWPPSPITPDRERPFAHVVKVHYSEYSRAAIPGSPVPLFIRLVSYGFETPGENWLALNPAVGRACSWTPSPGGLFRWINDSGVTMVESIWWVDGNTDHAPPHHEDEVGEGWLVVASRDALAILKDRLGPSERHLVLIRSVQAKQMKETQRSFRSEPFP